MHAGDSTVLEKTGPRSDDAFQKLLLRLSEAAAQGTPAPALIRLFCQATRGFFHVDATYFWRCNSPEELVGAEADGLMTADFSGRRLKARESAVAMEAIRQRRTLYVGDPLPGRYPVAAEFRAKSLMAAPLVVSNEVIGAAVFLQASETDYFNDDLAAKATILAGQLGSLLEASGLTEVSQEEHRRAEILVEVAQAVHAVPDASAVAEAVADRLRVLLRTRLVCILLRQGTAVGLHAVAAESPQLAASARARFDRRGLQFAADLAARAVAAGEPIAVAIDPVTHALSDLIPAGMLLAAPIRTSRAEGAVLVYPREEGGFSHEEKSLLSAVAGFGAVAIANAELYGTARAQAHELHQLLDILSELSSVGNLDEFLRQFVVRAAAFLGFGRAFVGFLEGAAFRIRWGAENGRPRPVDHVFPDGAASRALLNKEPFWANDPAQVPGANLEMIAKFNVRQLLAVPLLGTGGRLLGLLGVLDRLDGEGISRENVRSAQALAAHVAITLQATRNLHLSEQHRRRAESLKGLALELNSQLRLPECAKNFVTRAVDLMGAQDAAFAVQQGSVLETLVLHGVSTTGQSSSLLRRFDHALVDALAQHPSTIVSASAAELFGSELSSLLRWQDCSLVRLLGSSGNLVGVLCLANRGKPLQEEDEQLLQAIAAHASVALENARLFTRMDQANRHWIEIFDAITDFIVAHDQSDHILRVNRSLADFIGVQPHELIGVNMGALLAMGNDAPLQSCPFCRSTTDVATDEYVLPVLDRTYLVSTSRVHGANSEGLQTIHVLKDITDRREAERRYRELFDNIQEGVFFSTPDGRFIEVNDALVRMLGYRNREDLLQADVRTQVCFSAEQYEELAGQMQQHGAVRNHEQTLCRQDGSPVHVLINAFAVRDAQQRIVQYRGVMLDISGLRTFQSELQRERDFSGKILNNTQSLILVADTSGLVSYANRRWYDMGYQQNQLLSRPLEELIVPTRRQALNEAFASTLAGQQVDNLEVQIVHGEGRVGHFSMNLSPMRDEPGNVASIVVVMSDITDAATLQAKLLHTEKMAAVGQLVAGVAHEVNNPLTAILGFADLLMENPEVPESARKDLRIILQEAQRTKQIVQNLLSFARQMPPQPRPVQLNTILSRTVQLRAYDFHSRGVQVVEQLEPELPQVIGDAHQLQQVFLNILNNAYDAVRDSGRPARIEIRTKTLGAFVEVLFRDNGYGISFPERIFDPFFTTKEIGKGTGLGLSICYGIVREHAGEILCHNNAGGEGATFIVRLPAISETASAGAGAGVIQP
ncbi:MAG TPA: PAS domain S-box protein [Terriglobales bacterium]|nr:PAS domain S-box protein [Terriglobales bacterium]